MHCPKWGQLMLPRSSGISQVLAGVGEPIASCLLFPTLESFCIFQLHLQWGAVEYDVTLTVNTVQINYEQYRNLPGQPLKHTSDHHILKSPFWSLKRDVWMNVVVLHICCSQILGTLKMLQTDWFHSKSLFIFWAGIFFLSVAIFF